MRRICLLASIVSLSLCSYSAFADEEHVMPSHRSSPQLEQLKSLEGSWRGVTHEGDSGQDVTATYRVTSNGTAVLETIFEGTPMEMTSIYYDVDGKLAMTHYCAAANQPHLKLSSSNSKQMIFEYSGGENLDPSKDMHIHGLELDFGRDGKLTQKWQGYMEGKAQQATVLELVRKRS